MLDNKNYTDNPTEPIEEVKTSGSTLVEFGHKIFKGDKVIWSVFIILCIISLIEIFSATSTIVYRQQNQFGPILRHTMFLIGALESFCLYIIFHIDFSHHLYLCCWEQLCCLFSLHL